MLIKRFVRKNALNCISGKTLSKESKGTRLFWASAVSVNQQHPQLNGTKSVELEIVYAAWVHLLNEGRLKMDQTKKYINELQFYYITRWNRCSILTPRVINKGHIGPQFEYMNTLNIMLTSSTSNNELSKWLLQNACEGETRQRTSHVSKWVGIIPNVALAGLCAIPATSHQISGLVHWQADIQII